MNNLLSIGTVVLLEGAEKRLMIIGYYPTVTLDDKEITYDYTGCLFPEGVIDSEETLVFNSDQISKVFYHGLVDNEQKDFVTRLNAVIMEENNQAGNPQNTGF